MYLSLDSLQVMIKAKAICWSFMVIWKAWLQMFLWKLDDKNCCILFFKTWNNTPFFFRFLFSGTFWYICEKWREFGHAHLNLSLSLLTKGAELAKGSKRKAPGILFYSCQKCLATINYHNHTECQFRSFSTLTKALDLDPMKQKKADVMGLRKSPRGVKPHPHTPTTPCPPPPPMSEIPPLFHPSDSSEVVTFGLSGNMATLIPPPQVQQLLKLFFPSKVWAFLAF